MISILPENNRETVKKYCDGDKVAFNGNTRLIIAKDGENEIGYCIFETESTKITVLKAEPENNLSLFDGILRSALHVGINSGGKSAYYTSTLNEGNLKKLGFVADFGTKELNINKLFESCCCQNNKNS